MSISSETDSQWGWFVNARDCCSRLLYNPGGGPRDATRAEVPNSFFAVPDPDLAVFLNADPDPDLQNCGVTLNQCCGSGSACIRIRMDPDPAKSERA